MDNTRTSATGTRVGTPGSDTPGACGCVPDGTCTPGAHLVHQRLATTPDELSTRHPGSDALAQLACLTAGTARSLDYTAVLFTRALDGARDGLDQPHGRLRPLDTDWARSTCDLDWLHAALTLQRGFLDNLLHAYQAATETHD